MLTLSLNGGESARYVDLAHLLLCALFGSFWLVNFILLSWLNAFYSFDYQWSLRGRRLEERIQFFELNWAYFAGFGSVCTLVTVFCSFFSGAAILAAVYPLFILIACDAEPHQAYTKVFEAERQAGRQLERVPLPIFQTATKMTSWVVDRGPHLLALPHWLWQHRLHLGVAVAGVISLVAASYAVR
jgi:etoposide-induced 2.4 mRNA